MRIKAKQILDLPSLSREASLPASSLTYLKSVLHARRGPWELQRVLDSEGKLGSIQEAFLCKYFW